MAVALLAWTGCGDGDDGAATGASGAGKTVGASTPGGGAAQPSSGVSGLAIRRSDVGSRPDQPIESGVVVIVPAAAIEAFWTGVGRPAAGPPTPGKAEFTIDPGALPTGAAVARIEAGRFTSDVEARGALLCLADDLPNDTTAPPHRVNGCARYEAGGREVRLSSGFGGVKVESA